MKFPTFDEAKHHDYPRSRYAIDWDNGERIYKEPIRGIRVYENNSVSVTFNGDRDPYWRKTVKQMFDLDFRLLKEMSGFELFTKDGELVRKKHIDNVGPLLYVPKYNRVYQVRGSWRNKMYGVRFLHPDAQPVPYRTVVAFTRNQEEEQRRMETLKPYVELGTTLNNLGTGSTLDWYYTKNKLLYNDIPQDLRSDKTQAFCRSIASRLGKTYEAVQLASRDKHEFDYLIVKEK